MARRIYRIRFSRYSLPLLRICQRSFRKTYSRGLSHWRPYLGSWLPSVTCPQVSLLYISFLISMLSICIHTFRSPCRYLYSRYLNWFVTLSVISADSCANPSLKLLSACLCILLSLVAKSSDAFQVSIFLFFFPYKFARCFSAPADVAWCVGVSMMKNQKKDVIYFIYLSFC